jgi:hypothetical protein
MGTGIFGAGRSRAVTVVSQHSASKPRLDQPIPTYTLPVPKAAALAALGLGDFLRSGANDGHNFTRPQIEAVRATMDKLIELAPKVATYIDPVPWERLER